MILDEYHLLWKSGTVNFAYEHSFREVANNKLLSEKHARLHSASKYIAIVHDIHVSSLSAAWSFNVVIDLVVYTHLAITFYDKHVNPAPSECKQLEIKWLKLAWLSFYLVRRFLEKKKDVVHVIRSPTIIVEHDYYYSPSLATDNATKANMCRPY